MVRRKFLHGGGLEALLSAWEAPDALPSRLYCMRLVGRNLHYLPFNRQRGRGGKIYVKFHL